MRRQLLEALNELAADHNVSSSRGAMGVIYRHVSECEDPELHEALMRAHFMIASRRYLRAPQFAPRAECAVAKPSEASAQDVTSRRAAYVRLDAFSFAPYLR